MSVRVQNHGLQLGAVDLGIVQGTGGQAKLLDLRTVDDAGGDPGFSQGHARHRGAIALVVGEVTVLDLAL